MQTASGTLLGRLVLVLPILLLTGNLQAGATVKVKGDVKDVVEKVDVAFDELELDSQLIQVEDSWAEAVGMNTRGARLTVAVKRLDDDECEVEISGEPGEEDDIEERFLRLMQSR